MKDIRKGRLIIISAPSGAGKSTVVNELLKNNENMVFSVSYTTRAPRNNELEGNDYYFISKDRFEELISEDAFLEWAKVHTNYYGTSKKEVTEKNKKGYDVLLDIDVQGALQVIASGADPLSIFILPPSKSALIKRLENRGDLSVDELKIRVENAKNEITNANEYNYIVINDKIEDTIAIIEQIILSERYKIEYNSGLITEVLETF